MTTVVNKRDIVYIGRTKDGLGPWGNPFIIGPDGTRTEVWNKYLEYAIEKMETDPEFARRVKGLKGKVLVCWCAPESCHGDILARLSEDE